MSTYIIKAAAVACPIEWPALSVEITPSTYSATVSPICVFMTTDRIDFDCKQLSLSMPGAVIRVVAFARILAVYKDGECTGRKDIRDFYTNLTDEEAARCTF